MIKKCSLFILIAICLLLLSNCSTEKIIESTDTTITLTLACWISDIEINSLVTEFNSTHKDYQITIIEYYDQVMDVDAALVRMTADLVTGNTPDLFYLDSMDIMALINAKILADLYPFIKADKEFNSENYYMNIIDNFELNGSLYQFIPCFQIGCIYGTASILDDRIGWTIDEFMEFRNSYDNDVSVLGLRKSDLLSLIIQYSKNSFVDIESGSCDFECDSFYELLEFVNTFPEKSSDEIVLNPLRLSGIYEYLPLRQFENEKLRFVGYPSEYAEGPCAMALCSFGISASTEYPEICWEFLKSMLSEQNQSYTFAAIGFPISRSVLRYQLDCATADPSDEKSFYYDPTGENDNASFVLTQEEANYIINLIESISFSNFRYNSVLQIIIEDAQSYFSGDKIIEEVAFLIQSRVSTYMQEQQ